MKFITHLDEPGVAYLAPGNNGDPLWFTIGKGSEELVPTGAYNYFVCSIEGSDYLILTVYTLWKHPRLLPTLHTPSAVIPVLCGGADLMIPGGQFRNFRPPFFRSNLCL